ncbi:MAG: DUF4396 domain-containing protein [Actinomycetota bacterium]|nr:DUF4396 domain-containing protein [Actinomycetota bacterium]
MHARRPRGRVHPRSRPALAGVFSLGWLFGDQIFAAWTLYFVLACLFRDRLPVLLHRPPVRGLPPGRGLWQAVEADTFSITAWQVGMYGVMAVAQFLVLPALFGRRPDAFTPQFWFAMQLAMVAGFATAYPVNWLLIRRGIKEKM